MKKKWKSIAALCAPVALTFFIINCGGGSPTDPTPQPQPTDTPVVTATPAPSVSPAPTATPGGTPQPEATPTPRPTATPQPTNPGSTPTPPQPTPTATPTATPVPTSLGKLTLPRGMRIGSCPAPATLEVTGFDDGTAATLTITLYYNGGVTRSMTLLSAVHGGQVVWSVRFPADWPDYQGGYGGTATVGQLSKTATNGELLGGVTGC